MILSTAELKLLKPAFELSEHLPDSSVTIVINVPGKRAVRVEVTGSVLAIREDMASDAPTFEYYRSVEAVALAYGLPKSKLSG